jgi:hypothetical protein
MQTGFAGVQPNAGTTAVVMRDLLRCGNAHGAVDVYAAACAHGGLHDAECTNLLQAALAALTQPEVRQPQPGEAQPAPGLQLTAAASAVAASAAGPSALMPDMGEGWPSANLLAEVAGPPEVVTRASGEQGCGHAPAPLRHKATSMSTLVRTVEAGGMQPASPEPPRPGALQDALPQ